MSRVSYLFLFFVFFFCVGCTENAAHDLITKTPEGYSAPVKLAAIAPVQQDDRTWEEKAEAIMKIADQEAREEEAKAQAPVATVKVKAASKTTRVAKHKHHSKPRTANKKHRTHKRIALK